MRDAELKDQLGQTMAQSHYIAVVLLSKDWNCENSETSNL